MNNQYPVETLRLVSRMEIIPVNENAIGALMRTIEASKEELIDKGFSPRRPLPYDARRQPLLKLAA